MVKVIRPNLTIERGHFVFFWAVFRGNSQWGVGWYKLIDNRTFEGVCCAILLLF